MWLKKNNNSYSSQIFLPSQFSWFLIFHLWILDYSNKFWHIKFHICALFPTPPDTCIFYTKYWTSWYIYVSSTLAILSCISNFDPEITSSFYPTELFPLYTTFPLRYIGVLILFKFKQEKQYPSNSYPFLPVSLLNSFSLKNFIRIYGFQSSFIIFSPVAH